MTVVSKYTQTSVDDSFSDSGIVSLSRSPSVSSVECHAYFVSRLSKVERNYSKSRDPVIIERRNLVNISKLIVKELLDTSTKYGRMLDSDHMTLQHFFIVLEHVLRHGLRPKKGLLGPKKELWDILQLIEKLTPEANDITSSVRNLPTVKTHMGRARAWLRVALMQKKLADYLKVLIDHKDDVLVDYFEPDALMMSEEAIVIIGLLVGLNVIDCNLCVKEEDLDCELGVIDFSLYLRSNHYNNNGSPNSADSEFENMTTVLDQKNYIEELNRHLNATVANLQSKVEELTTSNALMKEDLDISRENLLALMQENAFLKARQCTIQNWQRLNENTQENSTLNKNDDKDSADEDEHNIEQLKQQLMTEGKLRREAEKELNIQICIKAEMEVAMKLLEKDIHEKQDTIISLRKQLEDIKIINLEMYKKLQECENSLKHKTELITQMEHKTTLMSDSMKKLQRKYDVLERDKLNTTESYVREKEQTVSNLEKIASVEGELKVEKEWRESLESSLIAEKERVSSLLQETAQLKTMASKYIVLQEDYHKLQEECREQEKALEELGVHLSISKLQVSDLKEEVCIKKSNPEGQWTSDKEVTHCKSCSKEFNLTRRKHHCRNCGNIFCNPCSDTFMPLAISSKPVRVCDECHHTLLAKFSIVS